MSHLSTHVLDTSRGKPAAGVTVTLERGGCNGWTQVHSDQTNADGRIASLLPAGFELSTGEYRLRFETGDYFQKLGVETIYPEIVVQVRLEAGARYHLPILASPFGYSTYRGS